MQTTFQKNKLQYIKLLYKAHVSAMSIAIAITSNECWKHPKQKIKLSSINQYVTHLPKKKMKFFTIGVLDIEFIVAIDGWLKSARLNLYFHQYNNEVRQAGDLRQKIFFIEY